MLVETPPRISILLPLFSAQESIFKRWTHAPIRAGAVERAVQSFIDAEQSDIELLIIDDGTRSRIIDHILETMPEAMQKGSAGRRIRVAKVPKSLRWAKLISAASQQAQGLYLGWLDPLLAPQPGWLRSLSELVDHHDLILMVNEEVIRREDSVRAMLESPKHLPRFGVMKRSLLEKANSKLIQGIPLGRLQEKIILLRALLDLLRENQAERLALLGRTSWLQASEPPEKFIVSSESLGWAALSFSASKLSREHWLHLANKALRALRKKQ